MTDDNSKERTKSSSSSSSQKRTDEDYGYYFYPDRGGRRDKSLVAKVAEGRSSNRAMKCITNVYWCAEKHPMVKLLMAALKSSGCPIDINRHVSCEDCRSCVNGGFDPTTNQIVVCQNNSASRKLCCNVMAHELIHMFDFCRAKVDFTNLEHLACTEIRAANFMHCSYISSMSDKGVSPFHIKQRQQECVKKKAIMSIVMVRNVEEEEARKVVDKVFTKCHNDLEPFGRIPRRKSRDPERMLAEGYFYGYCN
ncbi:Mitochondrial inner membrane protease ATP23 [Lamellibrachia satsuma]|nr:Mitochondrial inner membrane protease ATP23 [Lamellibrachia satsuma]